MKFTRIAPACPALYSIIRDTPFIISCRNTDVSRVFLLGTRRLCREGWREDGRVRRPGYYHNDWKSAGRVPFERYCSRIMALDGRFVAYLRPGPFDRDQGFLVLLAAGSRRISRWGRRSVPGAGRGRRRARPRAQNASGAPRPCVLDRSCRGAAGRPRPQMPCRR